MRGFGDTVSRGLRQIAFLLAPTAVVSAVLAEPIIRILYQRGAWSPAQTPVVAAALAAFSAGLVFNGAMLMLNRGFFSLQDNWPPTAVALGNLGLNAGLDFAFYRFGTWGIPLATAVSNIVATGVLLVLMRRRLGRIGGAAITFSLLKITVASAIVAVVSFAVWWPLDDLLGRSFPAQVVSLGAALLLATTALPGDLSGAPGTRDAGATLLARPFRPQLISHGPSAHPQLLDHRAHRPRQVDARRSHSPADGDRLRARNARPAARLDGPRARARHHDQGAGGARALEGPSAEPDRHAGARRLHLRGLALAAGVRRRAARRRRSAGDRSADARERVSRDREQPRDRPRREQDRPAGCGP